MKYIEYPLYAEGYINRFLTTGVFTRQQKFTKAVLSGRVNEWLKHGFSIHENPCRKEFIANRQQQLPEYLDLSSYQYGAPVTVFDVEKKLHMYVPFGNIGMEASGFYYTPTYLRSYSYVVVKAERSECVEFELTTCGGLTLWVNDQLVTDFVPFTRNMVKSTIVSVDLNAGENKFIVCLDDLAERDTDYYFRLRRIGNSCLSLMLAVNDEVDTQHFMQLEMMLEQMYFEKEAYFSEPVKLQISNNSDIPLHAEVAIIPGDFVEKMEHQWKLVETRNYEIKANQTVLELLHSDEIRPGFYYFAVKLETGGVELTRKIGNQLVRNEFLVYREESLAIRKQRALETVLHYGVDNIYKAAVYFYLNQQLVRAEEIILEELPGIRARKDCSDFHFVIVMYLYQTFSSVMSDRLKQEIEETMLGYRYWIDEPGDDVMWFFSENHALLFHICQYLAGQYLPEQVFTNSGLTGQALHDKAKHLLDEWFESFFNEFITEWNSNAYIPIDVLGLGTLYHLTDRESSMHKKAKRALDMIFYALCINGHKGSVMTSFGRTYEKEMKGNYNAGTTALLYIAYNAGYINRAAVSYISIILGDYQAPAEYAKYLQLSGEQELIHQNTQGFEQHVNLYLYKNSEVLLSTAVGYKPFQNGYQEHIVQATINERAQVFINHPGESQPYGSGRPNFWAGNGVLPMAMQHRGVSIIKYDIPKTHRIDYTHAYVPLSEFKQYMGEGGTIVLEQDGGYIGVTAQNGLYLQQEGPCRHREFISAGRKNVWVLKVAGKHQYKDLETFFTDMKAVTIEVNEQNEVTVTEPNQMVYRLDRDNQCYVNCEPVYNYPLTVEGIIEVG